MTIEEHKKAELEYKELEKKYLRDLK